MPAGMQCSGQAQAADAFTVKDIRIEGLQRVTLGAALLNLPFVWVINWIVMPVPTQ